MRKTLPGLLTALVALVVVACSKQEPPPPPPRRPRRTNAPSPREGAARIAIAPDGVHVQYRVYGAGEPALVFIHGWSCDSNYWREQLPAFKKKYTLVTVDLAGHGGTDGNRTRLEHRALRPGRGDRAVGRA